MQDRPQPTNPDPSDPRTALQMIALRLLSLDLDLSKIAATVRFNNDLSGAIAAAQIDGLRNAVGCLLLLTSRQ